MRWAILLILSLSLIGCKQDGGSSSSPAPTPAPTGQGRTCNYFGNTISPGGTVSGYLTSAVNYGQICQRITATCDGATGNLSAIPVQYCSVLPPKNCNYYGVVHYAGQTVSGFAAVSVPYGSDCVPVTGTCDGGTGLFDIIPEQTCMIQPPQNCSYQGQTYTPGQTINGFASPEVSHGQTCTTVTGTCNGANGQFDQIPPHLTCSVLPPVDCTFNGQTLLNGESVIAFDQTQANGKFCAEGQEIRTCDNGNLTGSFPFPACEENPLTLRMEISEGDTARVFIAKMEQNQFSHNPRIDWGDGTYSSVDYYVGASTAELPYHEYQAAGNYPVRILGQWKRNIGNYLLYYDPDGLQTNGVLPLVSRMRNGENYLYATLTEVTSWGDNKIDTFAHLFFGEYLLTSIPETGPDMSQATNMDYMFARTNINQSLSFNTSTITSMKGVFWATRGFNQPLTWQVQNVISMQDMFNDATSFASSLNFSSSTNLTNLKRMFKGAVLLNQPVILHTSKVVDFSEMFMNAQSFNQPLNFNTNAATNMTGMFDGAFQFNQALIFDTSNVSGMNRMFNNASSFQQNINWWCVPLLSSRPTNFDSGTGPLWLESFKPQWGTCPTP